MSLRIRKNDSVVVLSGREKNKKGKVLRVDADSKRLVIEGVNLVKRFARKTRKNPQGGLIENESWIALSNVALWCASCRKAGRVRTQLLKDGSKTRICAKCQNSFGEDR